LHAPPSINNKPLTILVIDDMEEMVEILRDGLEAFGHKVFTALSGNAGLAIIRDRPMDIVICDLLMDGLSGWEVAKAIQCLCSEQNLPKPPFVILTGIMDRSGEMDKTLDSGVDLVIQKPISMFRLLEAIKSLVEKG
jgi:CheY-like chemotaxis protein